MDFEKYAFEKLEKIDDTLKQIVIQTTKTNGRVTNLEDDNNEKGRSIAVLIEQLNISRGRDKILTYLIVTALTSIGVIAGFIINNLINKHL